MPGNMLASLAATARRCSPNLALYCLHIDFNFHQNKGENICRSEKACLGLATISCKMKRVIMILLGLSPFPPSNVAISRLEAVKGSGAWSVSFILHAIVDEHCLQTLRLEAIDNSHYRRHFYPTITTVSMSRLKLVELQSLVARIKF